jgi:hypothetical protein
LTIPWRKSSGRFPTGSSGLTRPITSSGKIVVMYFTHSAIIIFSSGFTALFQEISRVISEWRGTIPPMGGPTVPLGPPIEILDISRIGGVMVRCQSHKTKGHVFKSLQSPPVPLTKTPNRVSARGGWGKPTSNDSTREDILLNLRFLGNFFSGFENLIT